MSAIPPPVPRVRRFEAGDLDAVARLWHTTKRDAYPYLPLEQARSLDEDLHFLRKVVLPRCSLWVVEQDGEMAAFLALRGSYVDRLYVHPGHQRRGLGSALLRKAMELSPAGIELHTHQQNHPACAFYEKHRLRAVRFGTSPPPESEPDVEYHWRPEPPGDPRGGG